VGVLITVAVVLALGILARRALARLDGERSERGEATGHVGGES
jgi:hypothetical protein